MTQTKRKSFKVSRVLVTVLLLMAVLVAASATVEAASLFKRDKQSIFLVLDDSGSMGESGTNDANYSLQTLIAMTDKNDEVKLYFLNNGSGLLGGIGKIDMEKKSNSLIKRVKDKYPGASGGTPFDVVDVAQQELRDACSAGDGTDYWLVVFTDGGFNGDVDADADLKSFAQETLANGTHPNVLFVTIYSNGIVFPDPQIPNLHVVGGTDIIESMDQAARIISGRMEATDAQYSSNNTEVTFTIPYPAKNIIVFTQNNQVNVKSYNSASTLDTSENYTVSYPDKSSDLNDSTVCFITEANDSSIGMGQISLTFDGSVNPQDTVILFEPAIGITARFFNQDGQEVSPQDFCVGDVIKVEYTLCDSETKTPLPDSIFNGPVTYSSEVNGVPYGSNNFEFEIKDKDLEMKFNAVLPDGYILESISEYKNLKPKRTITFSLSNGGKFSSDYSNLKDAPGIVATLLLNGTPPSDDDFSAFRLKVKGENFFTSNFDIERDEVNNNFIIHPRKGFIGVLTPENKTFTVILVDKQGGTYEATMTVEITGDRPWPELLRTILIFLIIIYIIVVFATKKYFPRGVYFGLYRNSVPGYGEQMEYDKKYTFAQLQWNEFKQIFHGRFSFFKHFFKQFLPCQSMSVTLYGVGSPGVGEYSDITVSAISNSEKTLFVNDKTMQPNPTGMGGFKSDYLLRDTDFYTELPFDNLIKLGRGEQGYRFGMYKVLQKVSKTELGGSYSYFIQYAEKNKYN